MECPRGLSEQYPSELTLLAQIEKEDRVMDGEKTREGTGKVRGGYREGTGRLLGEYREATGRLPGGAGRVLEGVCGVRASNGPRGRLMPEPSKVSVRVIELDLGEPDPALPDARLEVPPLA